MRLSPLLILLSFLLLSCVPQTKEVVQAALSTILEPVTITLTPGEELGEMIVEESTVTVVMKIKNNSSDVIDKMSLAIDKEQTALRFAVTEEGAEIGSPGFGGTCGTELAPKASCMYVMEFSRGRAGDFNISLLFSYNNLVKPEQRQFYLRALVGEAASLVFTNDISKYNFGVIEQTIPEVRTVELEMQNVGGLTAKNLSTTFSNDNGATAFSVTKNTCGSSLKAQAKCNVTVAYVPTNNNYDDPEMNFSSKLTFNYIRDGVSQTSNLNGYFSFRSSTIEAKFGTNYKALTFTNLIAGNNEKKAIKITNNGYNVGILHSMNFVDATGVTVASCTKGVTKTLDCHNTLYDFPFIVEDTNSCFENEVGGIVGSTAGKSCIFYVTYWPSRNYDPYSQALHNFDQSTISLVYDSRWKDKEHIVTKTGVFDITANFTSVAKIKILDASIQMVPLAAGKITGPAIPTLSSVYEADFGRIGKVSNSSYRSYIQMKFMNIGENPATLVSLMGGEHTPYEISGVSTDLNSYYRGVKHTGCDYVPAGGSCTLSFYLSPIAMSPSSLEDPLMYDDVSDPDHKYKKFYFIYKDGSTYDDDGSEAANTKLETRLVAKLIEKGVLAFQDTALNLGTLVSGVTRTHTAVIRNVGTGPIRAISYHTTNNLRPPVGDNIWPYKIVPVGSLPPGVTKDCYPLLYEPGLPDILTETPDASRYLLPGQSCAVGIYIAASDYARQPNAYYTTPLDYSRVYSSEYRGTTELHARTQGDFSNKLLTFNYRDGDQDPANASCTPFGCAQITTDLPVSLKIMSPPNFVFRDPYPMTSAVIVRPAFTLPSISVTYPSNLTFNGYSVVQGFFESSYFTGATDAFHSSQFSRAHYLAKGYSSNDFHLHIGTFPVGATSTAEFSLENIGSTSAFNSILTEEGPSDSPISLTSFYTLPPPLPIITIPAGAKPSVKLNFSPTVAGSYERCYNLEYQNTISSGANQRICVLAEAVEYYPQFKVEAQDYEVAVDSGTGSITETATGTWVGVEAPVNTVSSSTTQSISFIAVRDSAVYALKRIRITNIGTDTAKNFSYSYLSAPNSPGTPPADFTLRYTTCTAGKTLAVGAYCEVEYKYKAVVASAASSIFYGGIVYEISPGTSQYVSQTFKMDTLAVEPAKVVMNKTGVTAVPITNWSNPLLPVPVTSSWPVDLGLYSDSATNKHLLLTTSTSTMTFSGIPFKNTSVLKASFLAMNSSPVFDAYGYANLYTDGNIIIQGSKACFYGDDENNNAIPANEKGFNNTSISICYMKVQFAGDFTFQKCNSVTKTKIVLLGGRIQDSCNPYIYELKYYNYKRLAKGSLYIHMKGFIEPNRSVPASGSYASATAYSTSSTKGAVTISWPSLIAQNPQWGTVKKYRVFYNTTPSYLRHNNLFFIFDGTPSTIPYVETTTNTATIANLSPNYYYYFRVATVREYTHPKWGKLEYVSLPTNTALPILTLPVPNTTYVYDHGTRKLIDKTFLPVAATSRSNSVLACAKKSFSIKISGTNRTITKTLISSDTWIYLTKNPTASTGYPGSGLGGMNHWVSDAAYDISKSIKLANGTVLAGFPNFENSSLMGVSSDYKAIYTKTCTNNASCNLLYKIVGGDGVDLYYEGTAFTTDTGISSFSRCEAAMRCPSNIAIPITSGACGAL